MRTTGGHIDLETLKAALRHGGRIDASSLVLGLEDARVRTSDARWGAHLPAQLMAAWDFEKYGFWEKTVGAARQRYDHRQDGLRKAWEARRALRGETGAGPRPAWKPFDPTVPGMGVRQFEALSLAARVTLALLEGSKSSIRAKRPQKGKTWLGLLDHAVAADLNLEGFKTVYAEDILKALAWAADEVGPDQGRGGSALTQEQLAMRSGLQLVGCHVTSRSDDGLRLVNARLPFSLRLIGCVIDCPILLSHCELVSLDLSGSSLISLDAGGLKASGSVHMRRTVVRTPVSFAGARIAGVFNASDAIISPFQRLPKQVAVDPEHGMLNLSKATIENEVRLERTRIWGGLSLRGAVFGRSLHLNRAVIISPLGLMEKWFAQGVRDLQIKELDGQAAMHVVDIDSKLGDTLHEPRSEGEPPQALRKRINALKGMEVLRGEDGLWRSLVERTLSRLKPRALISAIRADGLQLDGTLFARGLIANGRIRIKYARIGGSLRLEGALLRSAATCRRSIEHLLKAWEETGREGPTLVALRKQWNALIRTNEAGWTIESPDVALDLRGAELRGDLALHCDAQGARLQDDIDDARIRPVIPRNKSLPAHVQGNLLLRGLKVEGAVRLRGMVIEPEEPTRRVSSMPPESSGEKGIEQVSPEPPGPSGENSVARIRSRKGRKLWDRNWFPWQAQPDETWERERVEAIDRAGRLCSVDLKNASIARDADFSSVHGLFGVDLQNASIGGDLSFSAKSSGRARPDLDLPGFIYCKDRAQGFRGALHLQGAKIGGDAMLTFDPATGPIIKAGMATVGGRLDIYPQPDARSYQLKMPDRENLLEDARNKTAREQPDLGRAVHGFWLDACRHPRLKDTSGRMPVGRVCDDCGLLVEKVEDHLSWYIDLRHARATVFGHPPAAWPDPGALSLDGFVYEQTSDLGPLAPQPSIEASPGSRWRRSRIQYVWRRRPLARYVLGAAAWLGVIAACLAGAWGLWWLADAGARLSGSSAQPFALAPGLSYLAFAFLTALALSLGIMFSDPGLRWSRSWPFLRNDDVAPRALEYLRRQRLTGNRFKYRPASYHVLDTYVRAAKSLREAGRYISANLVEEERLRRRTEMLSWRLHGPVKLAMKLVDLFAGYGFKLSRAFAWTGVFLFGVAILAHSAAAFGYLERVPRMTAIDGHLTVDDDPRPACDVRAPQDHDVLRRDCPGLLYAADLALPFVDFGEAGRWKPTLDPVINHTPEVGDRETTQLDHLDEPQRSLTASLLLSWPSLVAVLGLLFTAVMGAAAATRVESALARVEE